MHACMHACMWAWAWRHVCPCPCVYEPMHELLHVTRTRIVTFSRRVSVWRSFLLLFFFLLLFYFPSTCFFSPFFLLLFCSRSVRCRSNSLKRDGRPMHVVSSSNLPRILAFLFSLALRSIVLRSQLTLRRPAASFDRRSAALSFLRDLPIPFSPRSAAAATGRASSLAWRVFFFLSVSKPRSAPEMASARRRCETADIIHTRTRSGAERKKGKEGRRSGRERCSGRGGGAKAAETNRRQRRRRRARKRERERRKEEKRRVHGKGRLHAPKAHKRGMGKKGERE